VETGNPALGPQVDPLFRTSHDRIFAAGNVLRGVETADWAALEGRSAARSIAQFLEKAEWPANRIQIGVEAPLAWISPNVVVQDSKAEHFRFRSYTFCDNAVLQVKQGDFVLYQKHFRRLNANTSLNLSGDWVREVDFTGEPVKLVAQS
jgi:hypothetical protein